MLLIFSIILFVIWAGGFLVFHVAGALIHLVLLLAVILLIVHLVTGRSAVESGGKSLGSIRH
jgi:hypothetical protein